MQILMGIVCRFEFFVNTPFLYLRVHCRILFTLFFLCSMAMIILAFMLSTLINNQRIGYTISFLFLLVSIIIQLFLSQIYLVYMVFYPEKMSVWVNRKRYRVESHRQVRLLPLPTLQLRKDVWGDIASDIDALRPGRVQLGEGGAVQVGVLCEESARETNAWHSVPCTSSLTLGKRPHRVLLPSAHQCRQLRTARVVLRPHHIRQQRNRRVPYSYQLAIRYSSSAGDIGARERGTR